MIAVSGIVARKNKILLCKRCAEGAYPGYWEFPTEPVDGDETAEDALERCIFERLSVKINSQTLLGSVDFFEGEGWKILEYKINLTNNFVHLNGYESFKWLKINELRKFRLLPPHVMFINFLKKSDIFL